MKCIASGMAALAAVACLAWSFTATAQNLPSPKEFYFDVDEHAAPIVVATGEGDALVEALVKERKGSGRRAIEATAQLAHVAYAQGRPELGAALYDQALQETDPNRSLGRDISWNYGWDLYRKGDYQQALECWVPLVSSSLGGPSWIPPTLALVLWQLDRKEEAIQWYAAAVRTEPMRWGTPNQYVTLLPAWSQADRDLLAQVQAAWAANPPAFQR